MPVDTSLRTSSSFEKTDSNGLTLNVHYSMPFDEYEKSGFLKRGFGLADGSFTTKMHDFTASFCVFNGALTVGQTRHPILDISPFEIADANEWSGTQPIQIHTNMNQTRAVHSQERQRLMIASFNPAMGERFSVGSTHGSKDSVMTVQTRLNMVLNVAREIAAPFDQQVRENYRKKKVSPRDDDQELAAAMREMWDEINPHWEW